jgi:hypothetical protein
MKLESAPQIPSDGDFTQNPQQILRFQLFQFRPAIAAKRAFSAAAKDRQRHIFHIISAHFLGHIDFGTGV